MEKQHPLRRFRAGPVSVALWENRVNLNGKTALVLKASVAKTFKDKSGQWKTTSSFGRDEIQLAIFCLHQAYAAIVGEQSSQTADPVVTEEQVV